MFKKEPSKYTDNKNALQLDAYHPPWDLQLDGSTEGVCLPIPIVGRFHLVDRPFYRHTPRRHMESGRQKESDIIHPLDKRSPWGDNSLRQTTPPPRRPLQETVRILLQCIAKYNLKEFLNFYSTFVN